MTNSILSIILFVIFLVMAGFHFYWVMGGSWGLDKAVPTKDSESKAMPPPKLATIVVGLILACFGLLYLIRSGLLDMHLDNTAVAYAYWFIPTIFTLRAIGEFKYVGLFKKIKHTKFGKADTQIFVPLCLFIGIVGFLIVLF